MGWIIAGIACLAVGFLLLRRTRRPRRHDDIGGTDGALFGGSAGASDGAPGDSGFNGGDGDFGGGGASGSWNGSPGDSGSSGGNDGGGGGGD